MLTDPNIALSKKQIYVHMSNPEKLLFEGLVEAVTAFNDKGKFDILPLHENFITLVKDKIIIHQRIGGPTQDIEIEKGVMKVSKNQVTILVGFELLEEIVAEMKKANS